MFRRSGKEIGGSLRVEKSVINDHGCFHGEGPEQERNTWKPVSRFEEK